MSAKDLPHYFESEAHLLECLDEVESGVLEDFPRADEVNWRFIVARTEAMDRERIALNVLALARDLRDRIKAGVPMPTWETVGRAMMLHDQMDAYNFPEWLSLAGRINAGKRQGKKSFAQTTARNQYKFELDNGREWKPGKFAREIHSRMQEKPEDYGLSKAPTVETITTWIRDLAPVHLRTRGRPSGRTKCAEAVDPTAGSGGTKPKNTP